MRLPGYVLHDVRRWGFAGRVVEAATTAVATLNLPPDALTANWTVNPFGQARLLNRFREKISDDKTEDLLPVHPAPRGRSVYARYVGIFSRLNREIFGKPASRRYNNLLASMALSWMGGDPLPVSVSPVG